jgi:MoaA/NifB/PqqE/SkfB family radical SAM enzyme
LQLRGNNQKFKDNIDMMKPDKAGCIEIDKTGRMMLPPELISRYGFKPGSRIRFVESQNGLQIQLPSRLNKLYIEPTSQCNLNCRTCIRNIWDEPQGMMSEEVFSRVMEGLCAFSPVPTVFFGGFGEPLFHPNIIEMVALAKALGAPVELITNGTLLTRDISEKLLKVGLDMLWVSLDGATPESYADIRLGAALPQVLENLTRFREATYANGGLGNCCSITPNSKTKLGIAFVAMKRNIADLPAVINIGRRFGVESFLVTNVLPYTREMVNEALYFRALDNGGYRHMSLPGMDVNETTYAPIYQAIRNVYGSWAAINSENARDRCPFVASGAGAISWDGNLSPCLPLLHSHTSYLGHVQYDERFSRRWAIGNIAKHSLPDLWNTPEHVAFRERVQAFDFSPCMTCSSCELSEKNEEDCFGNTFPTCGSCLWAQGVIQCP